MIKDFEYYRGKPIEFVNDLCMVDDPRKGGVQPFKMWPKQVDLFDMVSDCLLNKVNGVVSKARDVGSTSTLCAWSLYQVLYSECHISILWVMGRYGYWFGHYGALSKINLMVNSLPEGFLPSYIEVQAKRISNNYSYSTVCGVTESMFDPEDNRADIYLKEECSWFKNPQLLAQKMRVAEGVQFDISSRSRDKHHIIAASMGATAWDRGPTRKGPYHLWSMEMDWRDNASKPYDWYKKKVSGLDAESVQGFALEYGPE